MVHSYAAIAVDRLLSMREPAAGAAGVAAAGRGGPRFQPSDLAPLLQPLLEKLFAAFKLPESGENEYLMRAVMRVIAFVGEAASRAARSSRRASGTRCAVIALQSFCLRSPPAGLPGCFSPATLRSPLPAQARALRPWRPPACSN